jgi:hypothetical protein
MTMAVCVRLRVRRSEFTAARSALWLACFAAMIFATIMHYAILLSLRLRHPKNIWRSTLTNSHGWGIVP